MRRGLRLSKSNWLLEENETNFCLLAAAQSTLNTYSQRQSHPVSWISTKGEALWDWELVVRHWRGLGAGEWGGSV
jgi:hypothetical protein